MNYTPQKLIFFGCSSSSPFDAIPLTWVDLDLHNGVLAESANLQDEKLFVNSLGATRILVHSTKLIIKNDFVQVLRPYWKCNFRKINNVYSYEYRMNRMSPKWKKRALNTADETTDNIVRKVIAASSVAKMTDEYYCVEVQSSMSEPGPRRRVKVLPTDGVNRPFEKPLVQTNILERDGILYHAGFICKPEAFELIRSELLTPYTWYASMEV